jgi:rare lipoprotein A
MTLLAFGDAVRNLAEVAMQRNWWWVVTLAAGQVLVLSPVQMAASFQDTGQEEIGWASWYGPRFHGRQTASGERFSMQELTAAHRALPLGTKVLVMNLETEAQVEVKINDRGPYTDPQRRIIDLSRAAAESIGLQQRGVGKVRVVVSEEALALQDTAEEVVYEVQLGAFLESEQAHAALEQLWDRYPMAYVATREGPVGRYYRVRIGPFDTRFQAQQMASVLKREGHAVFVDAVATHALLSDRHRLPGEDRPPHTEAARRGEANAVGRASALTHSDSVLIAVMAFMVMALAIGLCIWTQRKGHRVQWVVGQELAAVPGPRHPYPN